jgi:hypothetical protein
LGPSHCLVEAPLDTWTTSGTAQTAQWIGQPASNGDAATVVPLGIYIYQTKFSLPKYVDPASVVLTGSVAAADMVSSLNLNGTDTALSGVGSGFFVPFTINQSNATFHSGDNTLSCSVQNTSGHSGLIVDDLNLTYTFLPFPQIVFTDPAYSVANRDYSGSPIGRVSDVSWYLDSNPNASLNFSIPATNNPTSYLAEGLPLGLTINATSGVISGLPTAPQACPVRLTAQNSFGLDSQILNFEISGWNRLPTGIIPQAFGNGVFVSVVGGSSYTSSDGTTWTEHPVDNSASINLKCVAFGAGLFIAGGDSGVIYTSPDGVNWTPRSSGISESLIGFAFGNNTFVGIASGLEILTSSDAQSWTSQQMPDTGTYEIKGGVFSTFYTVIFANNAFVVAGNVGIYSSFDGTNWIFAEQGHGFGGVVFAKGGFVAAGFDDIETSLDGMSWSIHGLPPLDGYILDQIVFGGDTFVARGNRHVAVPHTRGLDYYYVFFSRDGITWQQTITPQQYDKIAAVSFQMDRFFLLLSASGSNPSSFVLAHNTVFPQASAVSFGSSSYQVFENGSTASITLNRSGDLTSSVSVLCDTQSITNPSVLGDFQRSYTAVDGTDFDAIYQTVGFAPGETTKTVSIPITNNTSSGDGRREFTVELQAQTEGVSVGGPTTISILDDDKSLQINGLDSEQDSLNDDDTVSFSADLIVGNTKASATGPVRIKLVAIPGYNFFNPSFDPPPALPSKIVLGTFDVGSSVSGLSTVAQTVTGIIPAAQVSGGGYFFWWVYAQLEEQVGANWYAIPGSWPLLDGAILIQTSSGLSSCHHPQRGGSACIDTGGAVDGGNPGTGGSLPVLPLPPALSSINVSGPDQLNKKSAGQYNAVGTLSDGTPVDPSNISWSTSMFSISSTGLLTTGNVSRDTNVTVTATTTVAGVTQSGTQMVVVRKNKIKQPKPTVATPTISPNGGTFSQSVQVTLADTTPGATIRYTTNGKTPTKKSPVYSGPFTLTGSATVEAMGMQTGATNSGIASASFTITP